MQSQPRLTRSDTEVTIAGVCGGLGEYFGVDPIIVRLIFVLVTLTWGIGLPVYVALWILMPKKKTGEAAPSAHKPGNPTGNQQKGPGAHSHEQQQSAHRRVAPGHPHYPRAHSGPYMYNPQTGQPFHQSVPATGETIKLDPSEQPGAAGASGTSGTNAAASETGNTQAEEGSHQQYAYQTYNPSQQASYRRERNWRKLGFIFVGLGGLMLLSQFGIKIGLIVPPLMIIAGILLLKRG